MTWRGKTIVNLSRAFLDTNGVQQTAKVHVTGPSTPYSAAHGAGIADQLASLNLCSQKGLGEIFDGSVGAGISLWGPVDHSSRGRQL
jgi:phosphoribosylformylglycinamidine synthase